MTAPPKRLGVILAGGAGRRMGHVDKASVLLAGRPLWRHVADRIAPQVDQLAINAPQGNAHDGGPLICLPDPIPGRPGPLAGLLAALTWAEAKGAPEVLTVPTDTPFLPCDLVRRLAHAPAIAARGERVHPVIGLWPTGCLPALRATLESDERRILHFAKQIGAQTVSWNQGIGDPFANINTPDDLQAAEAWISLSAQ